MVFDEWSPIRTPLTSVGFLDPTDTQGIRRDLPTPNFMVPSHLRICYNPLMIDAIPKKTRLRKRDVHEHHRHLRKTGVVGVLDIRRHIKRFIETFDGPWT